MPLHLKWMARLGNIGGALLFGVVGLFSLGDKGIGFVLVMLMLAAFFALNLYLVEKSAIVLSEEAWLEAEIRKVLLRRKLARLKNDTHSDDGVESPKDAHREIAKPDVAYLPGELVPESRTGS